MTEPWKWLAHHKEFQEKTYGTSFSDFETDYVARTAFVDWNLRGAIHEICEAGEETPWKPWSSRDPVEMWNANRDNFIDEIVDVLHFLASAALAAQATDEEIERRYKAKSATNTQRQEDGYDAFTTKCPECRREMDKAGAYTVMASVRAKEVTTYTLSCNYCREVYEYDVSEGERLPGKSL